MRVNGFGGVLRRARLERKVRVGELAKRMQCRPSAVCRIESGQNPLLESTVIRYAQALGLGVELRLVPVEEPST
jgi:transcriptional regulator with XRE-family HTH domain